MEFRCSLDDSEMGIYGPGWKLEMKHGWSRDLNGDETGSVRMWVAHLQTLVCLILLRITIFTVSCQLSVVGSNVNMCYFRSFSVWYRGQYGVTSYHFACDLSSNIYSILPPSDRSWMLRITVKSSQVFAAIVICVVSYGGSHFCLRIPGESLAYSLSLWYVFLTKWQYVNSTKVNR